MAKTDGDDSFWNKSEVKGYNFDEEESNGNQMFGFSLDGVARLSQQIKAGFKDDSKDVGHSFQGSSKDSDHPELHDLISEKSLTAILEADSSDFMLYKTPVNQEEELKFLRRQYENRWMPPDIEVTVKKIMLGQPYSFELCKSLNSKTELLKAAIALGDGDAILMVVLFLSKTLKKGLFYSLLSTSPLAVDHYVNYLTVRMQTQELSDILDMLGRTRDAAMKQFAVACQNPQRQLERLKICARNHFSGLKESIFVENYIKFLEWQKETRIGGGSVVECLEEACLGHWGESKGTSTSPQAFSLSQGVSEKQFHWVALTSLAKRGSWNDINGLFITEGWLGGKKVKSILPMDLIVCQLHKLGAEPSFILTYIDLIENVEKRLFIARKLHCHKVVINIYASQRDRQALLSYKANLNPQSEDFAWAEHQLSSLSIKWKN